MGFCMSQEVCCVAVLSNVANEFTQDLMRL